MDVVETPQDIAENMRSNLLFYAVQKNSIMPAGGNREGTKARAYPRKTIVY